MSKKNHEAEREKRRRRTRMYQKYYGDDKSDNSLPKGCNFLDIFHADFVGACGRRLCEVSLWCNRNRHTFADIYGLDTLR